MKNSKNYSRAEVLRSMRLLYPGRRSVYVQPDPEVSDANGRRGQKNAIQSRRTVRR